MVTIPQLENEINQLKEAIHNLTVADNTHRSQIDDMSKRLLEIETFLPTVREAFSGKIAGSSNEANEAMNKVANADPDAAKKALEEAAKINTGE